MKKFLSLMLALALILGTFTFASADDVVTLRIYPNQVARPDDAKVSAALSELTMAKYGFKVELVTTDDFNTKVPLLIASDEPMDLVYDASWIDYYGRSRSGAYVDLTDVLADYPALFNAVNPVLWEGSKVDGRNFGVPTNKEVPAANACYAENSILEKYNIDASKIKKFDDVEIILAALKEEGDRYCLQAKMNTSMPSAYKNYYGVEMSDSKAVMMYFDNVGTFVNWYDTDEYMAYCELIHKWYELGYIPEDIATATDPFPLYDANNQINGKYGVPFNSYSPLAEVTQSAATETGVTHMILTPIVNTTGNCTGSMWCLLQKSQHKTEAMQFLEMMNTDPAVKNLLAYGIEGITYELVDGKAKMADQYWITSYAGQNWQTGNMFISYLMVGDPDNKWDLYREFNASAIDSPHLGFAPNNAEIKDKLAAINGVIAEYCPLLEIGVLEPEEYVPMLREALDSVGVDEVIAWYQAQYDAWVAAK